MVAVMTETTYRVMTLGPNSWAYSCEVCGALVTDRELHTQWHADQEGKS